jgi:hypothetical protein
MQRELSSKTQNVIHVIAWQKVLRARDDARRPRDDAAFTSFPPWRSWRLEKACIWTTYFYTSLEQRRRCIILYCIIVWVDIAAVKIKAFIAYTASKEQPFFVWHEGCHVYIYIESHPYRTINKSETTRETHESLLSTESSSSSFLSWDFWITFRLRRHRKQ